MDFLQKYSLWVTGYLAVPILTSLAAKSAAEGRRRAVVGWGLLALAPLLLVVGPPIVFGFSFHGNPQIALAGVPTALLLILAGLVATRLSWAPVLGVSFSLLLVSGAFGWHFIGLRPLIHRSSCGGQYSACESNLKNIGTALEMYATDCGGHYPPQLSRLAPEYLRRLPTCPAAGTETYSAQYVSATSPDTCTVYCAGSAHVNSGYSKDRPLYRNDTGLSRDDSAAHRVSWW